MQQIMQSVNVCSSVLQQTGQTTAAPRNGRAGSQGWLLLTAHFLSALSPCPGKTPQMQHDWLDACLLVTCQNDFSDILIIPRGTKYFWKAEMSFPLFLSKLFWVLTWSSWRSIWCPNLQPVFSPAGRLKTGISFCKRTQEAKSSLSPSSHAVTASADVFQ